MMRVSSILPLAGLLLSAAPALASPGGTEVPEPSDLALFALGLVGVILGYRAVRVQNKRDADPKPEAEPIERP